MRKKVFFLLLLFLSFSSFVYAQVWPGVNIICKSADFFSGIILVLGILYILKIGYKLIFPQNISDFSSEKKALAFVLLGLTFAISYLTIFRNIVQIQGICFSNNFSIFS